MLSHSQSTKNAALTLTFAVIKGPDGKEKIFVVLTRSKDHPTPYLRHPGGGVEDRETVEEAAFRELFDETGLLAKSLIEVPEWLIKKTSRDGSPEPHLQHVFIALVDSLEGFKETALDGDEVLINSIHTFDEVKSSVYNETKLGGYSILPHHRLLFKQAVVKFFTTHG